MSSFGRWKTTCAGENVSVYFCLCPVSNVEIWCLCVRGWTRLRSRHPTNGMTPPYVLLGPGRQPASTSRNIGKVFWYQGRRPMEGSRGGCMTRVETHQTGCRGSHIWKRKCICMIYCLITKSKVYLTNWVSVHHPEAYVIPNQWDTVMFLKCQIMGYTVLLAVLRGPHFKQNVTLLTYT